MNALFFTHYDRPKETPMSGQTNPTSCTANHACGCRPQPSSWTHRWSKRIILLWIIATAGTITWHLYNGAHPTGSVPMDLLLVTFQWVCQLGWMIVLTIIILAVLDIMSPRPKK